MSKPLCKLCKSKPCGPEAHLIPYWAYTNIIDGHATMLSPNEGVYPGKTRKGEYDKELVCLDCEVSFSEPDRYAKQFFMDRDWKRESATLLADSTLDIPGGVPGFKIHDSKAELLHRFILITLWRCCSSNRPICSDLSIGPHTDRVGQLLLANDKLDHNTYPAFIISHTISSKHPDLDPDKLLRWPVPTRIDEINYVALALPSFEIFVKVDSRPNPKWMEGIIVSPSEFYIVQTEFDVRQLIGVIRNNSNR